jgi:hypothetical protein
MHPDQHRAGRKHAQDFCLDATCPSEEAPADPAGPFDWRHLLFKLPASHFILIILPWWLHFCLTACP